jgi:hypothetical protein
MSWIFQVVSRLKQARGVTEIGSVIVLSLATIVSAWCAYQAARWGGIETFQLNDVDRLERRATQLEVQADQQRTFDANMFGQFVAARSRGEDKLADYLRQRFRPEARTALEAWLATRPRINPDAPPHPFVMAEYELASQQQAARLVEQASKRLDEARRANSWSDNYVLLTVAFTSVLFFTGICTKLPTQMMRRATLAIGCILFLIAVVVLIGWFPVAPLW